MQGDYLARGVTDEIEAGTVEQFHGKRTLYPAVEIFPA